MGMLHSLKLHSLNVQSRTKALIRGLAYYQLRKKLLIHPSKPLEY